jgi:hypothetical protein
MTKKTRRRAEKRCPAQFRHFFAEYVDIRLKMLYNKVKRQINPLICRLHHVNTIHIMGIYKKYLMHYDEFNGFRLQKV